MENFNKSTDVAQLLCRLALGLSFLSAVMDRLGFWGEPGQPNIAWGNWTNFQDYTHLLLPFLSKSLSNIAAQIATIAEVALAIMLMVGYRTRWAALGSSLLLAIFGITMLINFGIKTPFDYSVFTASAAALLLAMCSSYKWSLDNAFL